MGPIQLPIVSGVCLAGVLACALAFVLGYLIASLRSDSHAIGPRFPASDAAPPRRAKLAALFAAGVLAAGLLGLCIGMAVAWYAGSRFPPDTDFWAGQEIRPGESVTLASGVKLRCPNGWRCRLQDVAFRKWPETGVVPRMLLPEPPETSGGGGSSEDSGVYQLPVPSEPSDEVPGVPQQQLYMEGPYGDGMCLLQASVYSAVGEARAETYAVRESRPATTTTLTTKDGILFEVETYPAEAGAPSVSHQRITLLMSAKEATTTVFALDLMDTDQGAPQNMLGVLRLLEAEGPGLTEFMSGLERGDTGESSIPVARSAAVGEGAHTVVGSLRFELVEVTSTARTISGRGPRTGYEFIELDVRVKNTARRAVMFDWEGLDVRLGSTIYHLDDPSNEHGPVRILDTVSLQTIGANRHPLEGWSRGERGTSRQFSRSRRVRRISHSCCGPFRPSDCCPRESCSFARPVPFGDRPLWPTIPQ